MHSIIIDSEGDALSIYSDDTIEVLEGLGDVSVRRASHVEPVAGGWSADLSPVGGPELGAFRQRSEALSAEVAWLETHYLGIS